MDLNVGLFWMMFLLKYNIITAKWYFSILVCVNNYKDLANGFES